MPPVLSIVGKSDSGKTTLIEKIIPRLTQKGYRVGVVKHAHHGFDMDREGKDSYRHRQAGAAAVMVTSPGQIAMIKDQANTRLADLLPYFADMDLLISEGFKRDAAPKIEIYRAAAHARPACLADDSLVAMVTDTRFDVQVPQFAFDEIEAIIEFIIDQWLGQAAPKKKPPVDRAGCMPSAGHEPTGINARQR